MTGAIDSFNRRLAPWLIGAAVLACLPGRSLGSDARHEGVATCASTTCHGAARPLAGTPVQLNEYVTWSTFDPHAGAFRTLRDDRSAAIARRLGMGPADQAPACLACHSERVPADQQGRRFQQDDGIGCEACHGGAGGWLATHDDGTAESRAASRRAGLRDLDDPAQRGAVCLACHAGTADQAATHAMMAAGHPRLSFELDTFTELWRTSGGREHYRRASDPAARKLEAGPTNTWLTGLVLAATASVDQLEAAFNQGALPEFAAFNCYSCHRGMGLARWRDRQSPAGVAPGTLRINDSALRLVVTALEAWDPARGSSLAKGIDGLQRAANDNRAAIAAAAGTVRSQLAGVTSLLQSAPPGPAERRAILGSVLRASSRGAYPDYATAEQAAMAVVVLLADSRTASSHGPEVDALFAELEDDSAFDQGRFTRMLNRLAGPASSAR